MREVDVLVVGGGPGGMAAGIVFARQGLKTLVCESKRFPVDKTCGEGVMPTGLIALDRLGVKKYLPTSDYSPFRGIRYISTSGHSASGLFREGPGWGVRRLALSNALLQRAMELPDLEVRQGIHAKPQREMGGCLEVTVGDEQIFTRLLVGADGLNSGVRRWAGLQGPRGPFQRWGARQHFTISPWSPFVEVHWGGGIEAYVTPSGDHTVGVAFLWDRLRFPQLPGGKALMPALLDLFPQIKERLRDAAACDEPRAVGPLLRLTNAPVATGVVLIGDASGYVDAITGEGISLALAQALVLEKLVAPLLKSDKHSLSLLTARDLASYAKAHQAITQPYHQMTHLLLFLSRHPALAEAAIRTLTDRPALFQHLLSANMGLAPLWPGVRRLFSELLGKRLVISP